jgi:putative CocE/NonD family hydrolase
MGQTQWWTASMAPPHLTTIVPSAAQPDRFAHAPYNNGVLAGWYIEWCAMMTGRTNQENSSKARGGLIEVLKHTPYADLDAFMGMENAPWFKEIYHQNKSGDPYWTNISYQTPESYSRMTTPSLAFTGWFDTSHAGTSMNYFGMKRFGATPQARRPHIVIGPWIHIINTPVGDGIDYGPDATIDLNGYTARWFDHFLKGIDNGVEKDPPVYVFVMGENKWHAEQDWPLPEAKPTKYYLISNRHANSLTGIGGLTTIPPDTAGSNSYVYDPRNPTLDTSDSAGLANQGARDTRLSALGDEILVFQTPPLRSPVEVTGPIEATLYAATSARDTDWMVRLVDVYPDGRSLFLAEGVMRARNRDPANEGRFNAAQLTTIESGKVYQYTIRFWRDTANLFQRGHRIGVEISSSWYPYYIPNLNTGADNLAMVSLSEAVVAHQTVCHGGAYPSHILLPVIPKR